MGCSNGAQLREPFACDVCEAYFVANMAALLHAAASVGIERGMTTEQAIDAYFRDFHRSNHA